MELAPRKSFSPAEKFEEFLTHLPVTASDRTLMALKGHLLVEQALREFIYKRVEKPERLQGVQMSFPALLAFASSLDDGDSMSWVWKAAEKLNQVRNKLAHHLNHEKIEMLEAGFIDYVKSNDGEMLVPLSGPFKYSAFPLAIFQVYDRILSYPYFRRNYNMDFAIYSAIDSMRWGDLEAKRRSSHGPVARRKWPRPS